MKKVFITSAILLGITLLILGVYNFAFKNNSVSKGNQVVNQNNQEEKQVATVVEKNQEKITMISKEPIVGAMMDKKTEKIFYYSAVDGTTWQVGSNGLNVFQISNMKLPGLISANWSLDGTKVLTHFVREGKDIFYTYDDIKKTGIQLKDGLDNATWDSLGTKIIYKYYDNATKKRSLNLANSDGSNWQALVQDIASRNLSIAPIPLTSLISFWNSPSALEESLLQTVGTVGGEVKTIFKGRFGGDYVWSPDGSQALVSSLTSKDSKTISLGLINQKGEYYDLNIPTMVSKCVWSVDNKTVYYALPGGIPVGSVMPDEYQDKKFTTEDTFWKIDVTTGNKERILELADIKGLYDVSLPFLSSTEDAIFFTNRIDRKLYKVEL